jgi:hypothetical protein
VEGHSCEKEKDRGLFAKLQGQPAKGLMERHVADCGWLVLTQG